MSVSSPSSPVAPFWLQSTSGVLSLRKSLRRNVKPNDIALITTIPLAFYAGSSSVATLCLSVHSIVTLAHTRTPENSGGICLRKFP
ncbi:hypothetical protein SeMB42_g08030 [Synchytrium endobioticum]|uniref:Uncharacterized protein n=1 Tax=Synchytrium endobioticum TaxID=286115 RepID=A0A507BIL8_9FUNG|nr:hypothetical protein SeMB42_g08030 [Synchytrium endobioticum]